MNTMNTDLGYDGQGKTRIEETDGAMKAAVIALAASAAFWGMLAFAVWQIAAR